MPSSLRLTIAGFIGLFLHGVIVAAPGAFLPQWTHTFGETVDISQYYTAFLISSLAGLYLASRRRRRHPLFTGSFTAIAIALAFAALSSHFSGIWLAAVPIGFGDGALNLHCNSLVGELHAKRRILVLNWANATFWLWSPERTINRGVFAVANWICFGGSARLDLRRIGLASA